LTGRLVGGPLEPLGRGVLMQMHHLHHLKAAPELDLLGDSHEATTALLVHLGTRSYAVDRHEENLLRTDNAEQSLQ
jgi:hypothetical protein